MDDGSERDKQIGNICGGRHSSFHSFSTEFRNFLAGAKPGSSLPLKAEG